MLLSSKPRRQILIVSPRDELQSYLSHLFPQSEFAPYLCVHSAGEARRLMAEKPVDILLIDAPLSDTFGTDFALEVAEGSIGVLLLVKSELYEKTSFRCESAGVLTLPKPFSRQAFYSAIKLLAALRTRLEKMETTNRSLQEKLAAIRTVNHAKWLLIDRLHLSEQEAHRLIEKRAMDERISSREAAECIIRTYDG